jgi:hypothetical protein
VLCIPSCFHPFYKKWLSIFIDYVHPILSSHHSVSNSLRKISHISSCCPSSSSPTHPITLFSQSSMPQIPFHLLLPMPPVTTFLLIPVDTYPSQSPCTSSHSFLATLFVSFHNAFLVFFSGPFVNYFSFSFLLKIWHSSILFSA